MRPGKKIHVIPILGFRLNIQANYFDGTALGHGRTDRNRECR
jgi:hypothetical protein